MAALVDTSALFAMADRGNVEHAALRSWIDGSDEVLVVPATVLPEIDYLAGTRLGIAAELAILRAVATGELRLEHVTAADLSRCVELIEQYADSDIGLVDASVVALAERLRITRVLTLDRRHFAILRPKHCSAFELLP